MGGEPEIFHTDADLDPMEPIPEPDPGQAPQTLHAGAAAPGPVPQTFHTDADLAEPLRSLHSPTYSSWNPPGILLFLVGIPGIQEE